MKGLHLVSNAHAVLAIVRRKRKCWPPLAAPIYPDDNQVIARAASILVNVEQGDGALTPDQARDIVSWSKTKETP